MTLLTTRIDPADDCFLLREHGRSRTLLTAGEPSDGISFDSTANLVLQTVIIMEPLHVLSLARARPVMVHEGHASARRTRLAHPLVQQEH